MNKRYIPQTQTAKPFSTIRSSKEGILSTYDFETRSNVQYAESINGVILDFTSSLISFENKKVPNNDGTVGESVIKTLSTTPYKDPEKNIVENTETRIKKTPQEFMTDYPKSQENVSVYVHDLGNDELVEIEVRKSQQVLSFLADQDSDEAMKSKTVSFSIQTSNRGYYYIDLHETRVEITEEQKKLIDSSEKTLKDYLSSVIYSIDDSQDS